MMRLNELIHDLNVGTTIGTTDIEISDVVHDSRQVKPGTLFVCLTGVHVNGHDYLEEAFRRGAIAALVQETRGFEGKGTLVVVEDTGKALEQIAPVFFKHPGRKLRLIGVVGTNGKTTSTYMIKSVMEAAGRRVGLIGTIRNMIGDKMLPTTNTTPGVLELQRLLANMVDEGIEDVVMEVSSHAIALNRIADLVFSAGLFTNITQDHLDFHKTFEEYLRVKTSFFQQLAPETVAVINRADPHADYILERTVAKTITYGQQAPAEITAEKPEFRPQGTTCRLKTPHGEMAINIPMAGEFNLMNAMGSIGIGLSLGVDLVTAVKAIERLPGVPGRFQRVPGAETFGVIVDYAHTPDGLDNVLRAAKALRPRRLITVFGCGGDRDRTKRPMMGEIAANYSDHTIVTSDNPRSEKPESIIQEIEAGLPADTAYESIADRREAIRRAIAIAAPNDLIIIAGKGHETYQQFADHTIHFDDVEVAAEAMEDKRHGRL